MSFWNSKFVKDLENGKMPEVPVAIDTKSILALAVAMLMVLLIVVLSYQFFKKL